MEQKYIEDRAVNGLWVRIPVEQYPQWKKAQDEMRKSGKMEADPQIKKSLMDRIMQAVKK